MAVGTNGALLPEKFDLPKAGWYSNVAWDPGRGVYYASRMGRGTYKLEWRDFDGHISNACLTSVGGGSIIDRVKNVYLDLTDEFNDGRLRAVVSSGQAVVLHRLAFMSKDGDWIVREDAEATSHVLSVLERRGAKYRFGAPFDVRWLAGGWSCHLEFRGQGLRVRTDFVTRPPRLSREDLLELWSSVESMKVPVVGARLLAEIKKTAREKDYPVIGELARLLEAVEDQFLYSRSARDLLDLARTHPDRARDLARRRPVLGSLAGGREALEAALDRERRELIALDEQRLDAYAAAARPWADSWPDVQREISDLPLTRAHDVLVERATGVLPEEALP